jgi:hypothetical protein
MKDRETHDHRDHTGTGYTRRGWTVTDQTGERRARLSWQLAGKPNREYISLTIDANAAHPATGFELGHYSGGASTGAEACNMAAAFNDASNIMAMTPQQALIFLRWFYQEAGQ